ncbi:MAG TPA: hypothetical protein VGE78_10100, partial [Agromyces sp.]
EFGVGVQVTAYGDHVLAHRLDPRQDVRDQQLMTHPAILASGPHHSWTNVLEIPQPSADGRTVTVS